MTFLIFTAIIINSVIGEEVRIKSVDDFIDFSNNVNIGTNYTGTTAFLDSDLDLTGKTFEPIGNSSSNYFSCVFDGQGHMISNLVMAFSSRFVGLFGYSAGLTIRNVIFDSSCSITSLYSSSGYVYVGGTIGYCGGYYGSCTIENSVNMASVTFNGNASDYFYLGGIAGSLDSWDYESTVRNCVNYGDIIHSGESGFSSIGGIVSRPGGYPSSTKGVYIYNCFNHGTITYNSTTSNGLRLGGIVGVVFYNVVIENCVSSGEISSTKSSYIGSIAGEASEDTTINYCYYTSDLSRYNKYGFGEQPIESNTLEYNSTTFELNGTVSTESYTGNSLIDALNAAVDNNTFCDYSHWLLNKGRNNVSFTTNGRTTFTLNSQIIILPSLASEGNKRTNWYNDGEFTEQLTISEITSATELHGLHGIVITVTFDVNGEGNIPFTPKDVILNGTYGDLPEPEIIGYTFVGWFTEKNESVTKESIVKIPADHTLYAHWLEISSRVEIVFGSKDMTQKDIERVIKQCTNVDFDIIEIESSGDETRVIVKFVDAEVAEDFVQKVKDGPEWGVLIKGIGFVQKRTESFSVTCHPMKLLLYLF